MPYIKDPQGALQASFEGKCNAFRTTLFPPPPTAERPDWTNYQSSRRWEWPPLTPEELQHACSSKIKSKSPGPDGITQEIITRAYEAIPEVFLKVYSKMINIGYHPKRWKEATGAILPKPNKPDYSVPKAYRIITLLNCLGKVGERIMAQRLSFLAETTNLLHHSQIGGRLKKSAIDAALLLTNEVQSNKKRGWKTSTLFIDIKGAYDHVAKNRLLKILQDLQLPINMISWTLSFLEQRQLRLAFDGQIQDFSPSNTGVPQGSPVSPILFLIYIKDLFKSKAAKWISYVDDISLTVSSTSIQRNARILGKEAKKLYTLASRSNIAFDLEKTELIHWTNSPSAIEETVQLPNNQEITPKQSIKWLGIQFDVSLSFKQHVAIKTAKALKAFHGMARLANIGRGLTPFALRQLYIACVTSIADYGSVIWWRGQSGLVDMLQKLQNQAIRKILGVFRTAPITPIEVESAIPPPEIRLNLSLQNYALRILKLSPNHPIKHTISQILDPQEQPQQEKTRGPLQLQRIHDSIKDLYDQTRVERISHFFFAPWNKRLPYKVNISPLSKENEAKRHIQLLQNNPHNSIFIYTDASLTSTPESTGIGVGLAITSPPSEWIHREIQVNIGPDNLVYNGELEGTTRAIEQAAKIAKKGLHFHIFSDNQAGLLRLKTPSDDPGQECQIRAITAATTIINKKAKVTLNWVPGHTDIKGNERADLLAKKATTIHPTQHQISFAMIGVKIRQRAAKE